MYSSISECINHRLIITYIVVGIVIIVVPIYSGDITQLLHIIIFICIKCALNSTIAAAHWYLYSRTPVATHSNNSSIN